MTVEKRYITEEAREEARQRIAKRMEEWKNVRAEQGKHQALSVKERIAAVRERQSNIFADLDAAMKTLKPFYIDGGGSGAVFIAEVINGLIDCSLVRLHNIHHLDSENFEAVMDVIRAWRTWPGETRTRMIAALYKDDKR